MNSQTLLRIPLFLGTAQYSLSLSLSLAHSPAFFDLDAECAWTFETILWLKYYTLKGVEFGLGSDKYTDNRGESERKPEPSPEAGHHKISELQRESEGEGKRERENGKPVGRASFG